MTLVTGHSDHFLLLTPPSRTFIGENLQKEKQPFIFGIRTHCKVNHLSSYINLSLSLRRVRFAIPINVFADFNVGHLSSLYGDGDVAQRTYWDLDVLQENKKNSLKKHKVANPQKLNIFSRLLLLTLTCLGIKDFKIRTDMEDVYIFCKWRCVMHPNVIKV